MPVPPQRRDLGTGARSGIAVKGRARAQSRSPRRCTDRRPRPGGCRSLRDGPNVEQRSPEFRRRAGPDPAPASCRWPCGTRDAIMGGPRLHACQCRHARAVSGQSMSNSARMLSDARTAESRTGSHDACACLAVVLTAHAAFRAALPFAADSCAGRQSVKCSLPCSGQCHTRKSRPSFRTMRSMKLPTCLAQFLGRWSPFRQGREAARPVSHVDCNGTDFRAIRPWSASVRSRLDCSTE